MSQQILDFILRGLVFKICRPPGGGVAGAKLELIEAPAGLLFQSSARIDGFVPVSRLQFMSVASCKSWCPVGLGWGDLCVASS